MSAETLTLSLGAATGAIWATTLIPRLRVFHLVLIYMLAVCCLNPALVRIGGGPLSIDRIVLLAMLGVYAWRRYTGAIEPLRLSPFDWLLAGFLGLIYVSALTIGLAPLGDYPEPIGRLLHGYTLPFLLYWVTRNTFDAKRDGELLLHAMFVFCVYLTAMGLLEYFRVWGLLMPPFMRDPKAGTHFGRVRGPFLQAASMGMWLTFTLLAIHALWPRLRTFGRLAAGTVVPAALVAMTMTLTRSVWLGAAAAAFVLVWFAYRGRRRIVRLAVLGLAGAVVFAAVGQEIIRPTHRPSWEGDPAQAVVGRQALANIAWRMFLDRPVLGDGFGHYFYAAENYFDISDAPVPLYTARGLSPHSTFLSLLTEVGLVGLGLWVVILAIWARTAARVARFRAASPVQRALACLFLAGLACYAVQMLTAEVAFSRQDSSLVGMLAGCMAAVYASLRTSAQADRN